MEKQVIAQSLPGFQTEATVGKISVKPGDSVVRGQEILDLEGTKTNMPLCAEAPGKIVEILVSEGEIIHKGEALYSIDTADETTIIANAMPGFQEEATVGKIGFKKGDVVRPGDVLVTFEGAKCNLEFESQYSGKIISVLIQEGNTVHKNDPIFIIAATNTEEVEEEQKALETDSFHGEVVVLGGGPGGYVAAIRAAQRGKKTILIEEDELGGTCLNRGCIPTKTMVQTTRVGDLIHNAQVYGISQASGQYDMNKIIDRKNDVVTTLTSGLSCSMQRHEVTVLRGHGSIEDNKTLKVELHDKNALVTFDDLILAPGSCVSFPGFPGADLEDNLTSDDLLDLREIPESMIILGGRVIAMEFAFIYAKLGTKVTVIQRSETIFPNLDDDVIQEIQKAARACGITLFEGTNIHSIKNTEDGKKLVEFEHDGKTKLIVADKLAVATGRKPKLEGLDLNALGVEVSEQTGGIKVDDHMRTSAEHIYAIGDATNIYCLAHVASKHGLVAVENILGNDVAMEYHAIPEAVFTDPEIGLVGKGEKQLQKEGVEYLVGKFPYMSNGKALVENATEGFIKIIATKKDRKLVGASLVGIDAADLLSVYTNLISIGATIDEAENVVYAHPTVSETLSEALMDLNGESIHK